MPDFAMTRNHAQAVQIHRQLAAFLDSDPTNALLLKDSFRAAIAAHLHAEAKQHLDSLRRTGELTPVELAQRQAELLMAQELWTSAAEVLATMAARPDQDCGSSAVHRAQLEAYAWWRAGQPAKALAALEPHVLPLEVSSPAGEVQQLWLRICHHTGDLGHALLAAKAWYRNGTLSATALATSSLIALDAGSLTLSRDWSERALREADFAEALVARGTLRLGASDIVGARSDVDAALNLSPDEGRAWSLKAFVHMLDQDSLAAATAFDRALELQASHIGTWHGRAWLAILQRRLDAADQDFVKALELDHNFAETHGGRAVVAALGKREAEARQHIAIASRLNAQCASARFASLILSGHAGDADAVQALAKEVIVGSSSRPR